MMLRCRRAIAALLMAMALPCMPALSAAVTASTTSTAVFDSRFRALSVENPDDFLAPPVVRLGTSDRLVVKFDLIGSDVEYLAARLVHCDAGWQPSQLVDSEFLDGFNFFNIEDFAFSSNTFVHYVNYRVEVPNESLRPTVSGNYLLQVYPQDNPGETLLQVRFCVSEDAVGLRGGVSASTDRGLNTEWQQLSLAVDPAGLDIRNPFSDLIVTITQNNSPETLRVIDHPQRLDGRTAVYEHMPQLIFPASNEFRRFETIRADYPGMHADSVRYMGSNYHAFLTPDYPRVSSPYVYDRTQFGRFKADEYNASDPDIGADYVTVHFTLRMPERRDADIYVDGDLSNRSLSASNRMVYDNQAGAYTLQMPLKQGSYNYRYLMVPHATGIPDAAAVEGNKFETINSYQVCVYMRQPGQRADRLVGAFQIMP